MVFQKQWPLSCMGAIGNQLLMPLEPISQSTLVHKIQSHGKGGDLGSEGTLREFGKRRNAQGGVMGTLMLYCITPGSSQVTLMAPQPLLPQNKEHLGVISKHEVAQEG